TTNGAGAWSFDYTGTTLAEGSYTFTATATDAAGNASGASASLGVTVDITPPAAPAIASFVTDSGTMGDFSTSDHTLAMNGTAEANSTVSVFDGGTLLGTTTADASGNWSFLTPAATPLSSTPGGTTHTITAKATDAAGNLSAASAPLTITVTDQSKLGAVA